MSVRLASLLVFASGLSATGHAADAVTDAAATTPSVTPAPVPRPAAPRAMTPETSAKLSALVPRFEAAPTKTDNSVVAPVAAKEPEVVKPRNTIIRLPDYVVRDPKVRPIKEREVLTPKERLDLARKQHPGIRVGNLFGLNNGVALAMAAEQERLDRKREFENLAELTRLTDPASHPKVKREVEQAFMRERDFGR